MSDELEQLEEVESPEVEAAPEPAAEPAPEFNYEPDFFREEPEYDAPTHQERPPQYSQEQIEAYNNYVRQQQAYQQAQGAPATEGTLDRLVRNPDGTISEIAGRSAQMIAQQMLSQYLSPLAQQQQQFIQGQARYHAAASDERIKGLYREHFTKDETFASNERVRHRVDSAIRGLREQAIAQAQMGDPTGFNIFSNPTFGKAVLALAKIMEGEVPTAAETAAIPHVERTTPAARREPAFEIDPDTKSALARVGISEERYLKSLEEQSKHDDFQG